MNQTHLHLIINHLPIFGSVLGAFILGYGLWKKSSETITASYYVFIISAIGAGLAYLTGEPAEESVENVQGIAENMIEAHEESGFAVLITFISLGLTSFLGILLSYKKSIMARPLAFIVLFVAFVSFGFAARSGYLGGQIRHTEISGDTVVGEPAEDNEHNE